MRTLQGSTKTPLPSALEALTGMSVLPQDLSLAASIPLNFPIPYTFPFPTDSKKEDESRVSRALSLKVRRLRESMMALANLGLTEVDSTPLSKYTEADSQLVKRVANQIDYTAMKAVITQAICNSRLRGERCPKPGVSARCKYWASRLLSCFAPDGAFTHGGLVYHTPLVVLPLHHAFPPAYCDSPKFEFSAGLRVNLTNFNLNYCRPYVNAHPSPLLSLYAEMRVVDVTSCLCSGCHRHRMNYRIPYRKIPYKPPPIKLYPAPGFTQGARNALYGPPSAPLMDLIFHRPFSLTETRSDHASASAIKLSTIKLSPDDFRYAPYFDGETRQLTVPRSYAAARSHPYR